MDGVVTRIQLVRNRLNSLVCRYLHTGMPQHVLATLANCSLKQVQSAIKAWHPRWLQIGKAFTRMTWLGEFPKVFELSQPHQTVDSRSGESGNRAQNVGHGETEGESNMDGDSDNDSDSDIDSADRARASPKRPRIEPLHDVYFVSLDGKAFELEQFHQSHLAARCCYSGMTRSSGLQSLVWSLPCGIPILVTGLFGAKLSEKRQVQLHSGWLVAIPPGVSILQDRTFRKLRRYYQK